jgi:hypothetical protein
MADCSAQEIPRFARNDGIVLGMTNVRCLGMTGCWESRAHPPSHTMSVTRGVPGVAESAYPSGISLHRDPGAEACGEGERRVGCRGVRDRDRTKRSRIEEDRHGAMPTHEDSAGPSSANDPGRHVTRSGRTRIGRTRLRGRVLATIALTRLMIGKKRETVVFVVGDGDMGISGKCRTDQPDYDGLGRG